MDSNKDEALRCIGIAKEAIVSGNKQRALKFIGIAHRLNSELHVEDLLAACETLNASTPDPSSEADDVLSEKHVNGHVKLDEVSDGERNYTEEHVHLVTHIKSEKE